MVAEKNKKIDTPQRATGLKEADTKKAAAKLDALLKMVSAENEEQKLFVLKKGPGSASCETSHREKKDVTPATETMARILEEQGHLKRARVLRRKLLEYIQWQIVSPPEQMATKITELSGDIENNENQVVILLAEEKTPIISLSWNISRELVKTVVLSLPSCLLETQPPEQIVKNILGSKEHGPIKRNTEDEDTADCFFDGNSKNTAVSPSGFLHKSLIESEEKGLQNKSEKKTGKRPEKNKWENPVKIAARLTATFPDKKGATKRVCDLTLTSPQGRVFIVPLTNRPLWVCASLGLKAWTGRFVSAVHSELMRIPDLHKSK